MEIKTGILAVVVMNILTSKLLLCCQIYLFTIYSTLEKLYGKIQITINQFHPNVSHTCHSQPITDKNI